VLQDEWEEDERIDASMKQHQWPDADPAQPPVDRHATPRFPASR